MISPLTLHVRAPSGVNLHTFVRGLSGALYDASKNEVAVGLYGPRLTLQAALRAVAGDVRDLPQVNLKKGETAKVIVFGGLNATDWTSEERKALESAAWKANKVLIFVEEEPKPEVEA